MNLEDFTIWTYLRIEEILQEIPWFIGLRTRGQKPDLSDLEVLTIEVLGSVQGCADDKALWRYIKDHWKPWFPKLSGYKNFAKHCANLCWLKEAILERMVKDCVPVAYIADGVPVPICHYARASRCKSFKGDAAFGYCAAKDQKYYGFKGLAVITETGRIAAFVLTAANKDERQALYDLPPFIKGLMIGDKGFIGRDHDPPPIKESGMDGDSVIHKDCFIGGIWNGKEASHGGTDHR
mgnify:CR=1 FL=1